MPRGGKREGSGRKPGSSNKRSKMLEATIASLTKGKAGAADNAAVDPETVGNPLTGLKGNEDLMPLDFMLSLMRDEDRPMAVRMLMAEKAAPYVHAKLSAVEALPPGSLTQHEEALKALR